jgi:hypothetical protein
LFVEGERIVRDYLLSKGNRTVDTNSVQHRAFLIEVLNLDFCTLKTDTPRREFEQIASHNRHAWATQKNPP